MSTYWSPKPLRPASANPIFEMVEPETVVKGLSPMQRQRLEDGTPITRQGPTALRPADPTLFVRTDSDLNKSKYAHIDFKPPASVASAAARGLEYRDKASPSNKGGLTPAEASKEGIGSGVQRAANLKNRDTVTPETISKMVAFFARHEKNKSVGPENKDTPWNDKGYVAWLLWGGDAGKAWAEKVKAQMDKADGSGEVTKGSLAEKLEETNPKYGAPRQDPQEPLGVIKSYLEKSDEADAKKHEETCKSVERMNAAIAKFAKAVGG